MVDMFDHYPQPDDYVPNNYPKCRPMPKLDIVAGETAKHVFEVPFDVNEKATMCEVIYKLGVEPIVIKNSQLYLDIVSHEDGTSSVSCELKPSETLLFAGTFLSARVQLKFYMKGGDVLYSDVYKVRLMDAIDATHRDSSDIPTDIGSEDYAIGGFGYTED